MNKRNWLVASGVSSLAVAILHVGIIFAGGPAYRYFGAGEEMASLAEAGSLVPALVTSILVVIFVIWGLYAFSGAGLIRRIPLLRLGLVVISAIYSLRGLGLIPQAIWMIQTPSSVASQDIVSSLISLLIGILYCIGTAYHWNSLKAGNHVHQESPS